MTGAYYNEVEPNAAAWLRELINAGLIAPGDVDERDIRDVRPADLAGYQQCHFFAGIGVWSYALRLAEWADDRPVWTGSCPCQPFSAAGGRGGVADERHLWPHWHHLIAECRPPVVFGEQVASKDGLGWFDLVSSDLEGTGYAVGAADLCTAGVGAPHIRQRLYFGARRMVHADADGLRGRAAARLYERRLGASSDVSAPGSADGSLGHDVTGRRLDGRMAYPHGRNASAEGLQRGGEHGLLSQDGAAGRVAHASGDGRGEERSDAGRLAAGDRAQGLAAGLGTGGSDSRPGPTNGLWASADWLLCQDGKWRPVEPGTFPLAHGAPARVGRLRGYGNAINAEVARTFIEAFSEALEGRAGTTRPALPPQQLVLL